MSDNENKLKITVKETVSCEYIEKKSRFIAHVSPIDSEKDAMDFIDKIKEKYNDATHNVYAYSLNWGVFARYSDDGEPQGTAGMPVLNVIKMSGLTDICIVVTRYFGGTLLGAGGLVRAYSTSAKLALDTGELVVFEPYTIVKSEVSYSEYQKLSNQLSSVGAVEDKVEFGAAVTVYIAVVKENIEQLKALVRDITNGKDMALVIGEEKRPTKYTDKFEKLTKKEKK